MKGRLILSVEEAEKNHDKWLEVRQQGLGGSDVAAILGYNTFKSPYSLWAEKTGQVEPDDLSNNEYVYWGTKNEPNIADRFMEVTGKKVRRCGTLEDEEFPFFHANVDRWVVGENAGLEIKTAGLTKSKAWKDDEIPDDYYCQVQFYISVTDAEKWYIAVLIGGNKMVWKEVARNDAFIADMRQRCKEFWEENVMKGIPPQVDGNEGTTETLNKLYPNSNDGTEVALSSKAAELIKNRDSYKSVVENYEAQIEAIDNELKKMMGFNEKGYINDRSVTWKTQAGRVTIDSKRLKAEMPDVYTKYSKVGKATRVFKVK